MAALLLIYIGATVQPLLRDPICWRDSVSFALAGLGFVIAILIRASTPQHRHGVQDRQRLDVLATQCGAAYAVGIVTELVWDSDTVGPPVIISLTAVLTCTIAAESLVIHIRAGKRATNQPK
jgi:hypothetical protein